MKGKEEQSITQVSTSRRHVTYAWVHTRIWQCQHTFQQCSPEMPWQMDCLIFSAESPALNQKQKVSYHAVYATERIHWCQWKRLKIPSTVFTVANGIWWSCWSVGNFHLFSTGSKQPCTSLTHFFILIGCDSYEVCFREVNLEYRPWRDLGFTGWRFALLIY